MSASRRVQLKSSDRPGILIRCGLLDPAGGFVGAERHPDADLLGLIDHYAEIKAKRDRTWELACKYNEKGPRFRKLQEEAFSFSDEIERLEIKIEQSRARTVLGAIAKISLAMTDIDPMGEGSSKRGTIFRLALSALTDAKSMLDNES